MTKQEFDAGMRSISENWPKSFGEKKIEMIWEAVNELPEHIWKRIVDFYIGNSRQAPVLMDFKQEVDKYRKWQQRKMEANQILENEKTGGYICRKCHDSGWQFDKRVTDKAVVHPCMNCQRGLDNFNKYYNEDCTLKTDILLSRA